MKAREKTAPNDPARTRGNPVILPAGILGFEHLRHCLLLSQPGEEPFLRLQAQEDPRITFLLIEPALVVRDYRPDIPEQDVNFLGLKSPEDTQLYNIVTVRGPDSSTVNLKGPLVFNRHTRVGKQVIPNNAAEFSVQHPLPAKP